MTVEVNRGQNRSCYSLKAHDATVKSPDIKSFVLANPSSFYLWGQTGS